MAGHPSVDGIQGNIEGSLTAVSRQGQAYEFHGKPGIGKKQGAQKSESMVSSCEDKTHDLYFYHNELAVTVEAEGAGIKGVPPDALIR